MITESFILNIKTSSIVFTGGKPVRDHTLSFFFFLH